jgi:hypothetical protein
MSINHLLIFNLNWICIILILYKYNQKITLNVIRTLNIKFSVTFHYGIFDPCPILMPKSIFIMLKIKHFITYKLNEK